MILTLAISGYRSLRDLVIPLERLTVITGANGTGKSSLYKAIRLLADVAQGRAIAALALEGGLQSTLWAGPEAFSRAMVSMSTANFDAPVRDGGVLAPASPGLGVVPNPDILGDPVAVYA